jgi:ADP-dependent NAD(P)H-hydrate dehydratase
MSAPPGAVRLTGKVLRHLPTPSTDDDKEQRGRVLIVGGSAQVPGAALLAATAALRAGAGKLQIATARDVATTLAIAAPEALVMALDADEQGEIARSSVGLDHALAHADAVLIGSGMRPSPATAALVRHVAGRMGSTLVLDAGALSAELCAPPGAPFILTPHAGEMAAMAEVEKAAVLREPHAFAREFARRTRSVVVLKGATTFIASPQGALWVHRGGCPGLGTSGSGDVLAGIVAGLAARGGSAEQAALCGVLVHAKAGERLSRTIGTIGFLAREIPPLVPGLLERLT